MDIFFNPKTQCNALVKMQIKLIFMDCSYSAHMFLYTHKVILSDVNLNSEAIFVNVCVCALGE